MAGEILTHFSHYLADAAGQATPGWHGNNLQGVRVSSAISAVRSWEFLFPAVTEALPTGVPNLEADLVCNVQTGNAVFRCRWGQMVYDTDDPSSVTLNTEADVTLSWTTGQNNKIKQLRIPMDAATFVLGRPFKVLYEFVNTGWTVAATLTTSAPRIRWV